MKSSFITALCRRGEPLSLQVHTHTGTSAFHFTADLSLSAAHLVQVGSTATGVQLSFSAELVEQTAARAQWACACCTGIQCYVFALWSIRKARPPAIISSPPPLLGPAPRPAPVSCLP